MWCDGVLKSPNLGLHLSFVVEECMRMEKLGSGQNEDLFVPMFHVDRMKMRTKVVKDAKRGFKELMGETHWSCSQENKGLPNDRLHV